MYKKIKAGGFPEGMLKKKDEQVWRDLESVGMDGKVARKLRGIINNNLLFDMTRGIVHIGEVIEMVGQAFKDVMSAGPVAREPCTKVKVLLTDVKLHEDAIHRGPAQVLPAVREAIRGAMLEAKPLLFEPLQTLQIDAPATAMGELSKLVQNKRGQLIDMQQENEMLQLTAKLPIAEMFGLTSDLRSATEGRGVFYVIDQAFEVLPRELQDKIGGQIRSRKGLKSVDGIAMPA